jgi:DNA repair protein SbcC/Rad50
MLSKLFRNHTRFDVLDPASRRQAVLDIANVDLVDLQGELAELARTDSDPAVRRTAVARLHDAGHLRTLLDHDDREVAMQAATVLAERAATDSAAAELSTLPAVRAATLRSARDTDRVAELAHGFDQAMLTQLALESRHPRVRLELAERVFDEACLADLERHSRDRDKNVHRLARMRLDQVRQARADQQRSAARATELVEQLRVLENSDSAMAAARLVHIEDEWRAARKRHQTAGTTLNAHHAAGVAWPVPADDYSALVERVRGRVTPQPPPSATAPPGPSAGSPSDAVERAEPYDSGPFDAALQELTTLATRVDAGELDPYDDREALKITYSAIQQRWLAHADRTPPPEAIAASFHDATHRLHEVLDAAERLVAAEPEIAAEIAPPPAYAEPASAEAFHALWDAQRDARQARNRIARLMRRLAWPERTATPRRVDDLLRQTQSLEAFDAQCHAQYEALTAKFKQLADDLERQIEDGHLNDAVGLDAEARRLLRCLPAGANKQYQQRLVTLAARLQELKDWQTFATGPKRRELCEQVEALAAQPLEPKLQADRIKGLRKAWNALGPITHHRDRRLLDRFNAAAERAFEPCRAYFEAEAETRRFNLEQRDVICSELERYLEHSDWTAPDWKAAERILHAAQREWRKYYPVDRSAGRRTQQRFETLSGRLHGYLKAEWDRNVGAKEAIVAEVEALKESLQAAPDSLPAVIEQAKALQRRWRAVGVTPRGPDQRLWKAFRHACDDIFGFRDQSRHAQQHAFEQLTARVEALLDGFARTLENDVEAVRDGGASGPATTGESTARPGERLAALRRDIAALGELPRELAQRAQRRLGEFEDKQRRADRARQRNEREQALGRLQAADRGLGEIEIAVIRGDITDIDGLQRRLESLSLDHAPGDPLAARVHALERTLTQQELARFAATAEDASDRRLRLTIEAEIKAGLESPPADQQRRLALQVERLNRGFKHAGRQDPEDPQVWIQQWFTAGPWHEATPALAARFFDACQRAGERDG